MTRRWFSLYIRQISFVLKNITIDGYLLSKRIVRWKVYRRVYLSVVGVCQMLNRPVPILIVLSQISFDPCNDSTIKPVSSRTDLYPKRCGDKMLYSFVTIESLEYLTYEQWSAILKDVFPSFRKKDSAVYEQFCNTCRWNFISRVLTRRF